MTLRQIWKSIMLDDVLPELSVMNIMKLVDALKDFTFHDTDLTVTDLMTADTNDDEPINMKPYSTRIYHREFLLVTDNNTDSDYTVIYNPKAYFDQQGPAQTLKRKYANELCH